MFSSDLTHTHRLPARSRIRRLAAVAMITPMLPGAAFAGDLLDAYHLAQQQDQTLQAALHQRDAAAQSKPLAMAALLPQLTGNSGFQRTRLHVLESGQTSILSELQSEFPRFPPTLPPKIAALEQPTSGTQYSSTYGWSVNLAQTVFNWQYFQNLSRASSQVAQAQAVYRATESDLIYRVADAYFNVLYAQDTLRADLDSQAAYKRQMDESQKKFQVGLAAITDVRNAQAAFDAAEATVVADRRALDSTKRSLGQIVGTSVPSSGAAGPDATAAVKVLNRSDTPIVAGLQDEIPLLPPTPSSEEEWVNSAMTDNPLLLSYKFAEEASNKAISVAKSQWYPTVALVGQVGRSLTDTDNLNGQNADTDGVQDSIGLQLSWRFFQGGAVRAQVRQATAAHEQTQSQLLAQKRSIDQNTRDAYEGVMTGIASVNASKQAVLSAKTSLDATQVGLKVGTRTEVDVLNVQQALTSAQRTFYKSRYDYLRAVLALKEAAGHLEENDLAQIDTMLKMSAP